MRRELELSNRQLVRLAILARALQAIAPVTHRAQPVRGHEVDCHLALSFRIQAGASRA